MITDTVKSTDLKGKRVTLTVNDTPCQCIIDGCHPLTETVTGTIVGFRNMPSGPIGFLDTEGGTRICFDAYSDIKAGKISIDLDKGQTVKSSRIQDEGE